MESSEHGALSGTPDARSAAADMPAGEIVAPDSGHSVMAPMQEGNRSQKADDVLSESTALDAAAVPVW
jgi:hypothetical protein